MVSPMHEDMAFATGEVRLNQAPLRACLTCPLCGEVFQEATTIIECLHTFCKKCIYGVLQDRRNDCPACHANLGTNPLEKLRSDNQLAELRNKLFPPKVYRSILGDDERAKRCNSVVAAGSSLAHAEPSRKRARIAHTSPCAVLANQDQPLDGDTVPITQKTAASPAAVASTSLCGQETATGGAVGPEAALSEAAASAVTSNPAVAAAFTAAYGRLAQLAAGAIARSPHPDALSAAAQCSGQAEPPVADSAPAQTTAPPLEEAAASLEMQLALNFFEGARLSLAQSGKTLRPGLVNPDGTLTSEAVALARKILNPILVNGKPHETASSLSPANPQLHALNHKPPLNNPSPAPRPSPLGHAKPFQPVAPPMPSFKSLPGTWAPCPGPLVPAKEGTRASTMAAHPPVGVGNFASGASNITTPTPTPPLFASTCSPGQLPAGLSSAAPAMGPLPTVSLTDAGHSTGAEEPGRQVCAQGASSKSAALSSLREAPGGSGPGEARPDEATLRDAGRDVSQRDVHGMGLSSSDVGAQPLPASGHGNAPTPTGEEAGGHGDGDRGAGVLGQQLCLVAEGGKEGPCEQPAAADEGVWIILQSLEEASLKQWLPTVACPCIRIRDLSMTVGSLRRYVRAKLGSNGYSEVDILCQGQPLVSHLTLEDVKAVWGSLQASKYTDPWGGAMDEEGGSNVLVLTYKTAPTPLEVSSSSHSAMACT